MEPAPVQCAVLNAAAANVKPEVPSVPNPASPEVKQAASQAVQAVKVGHCSKPAADASYSEQMGCQLVRTCLQLCAQGKEASAVEATAPAAPNAILLGLAAAGLAGAGRHDVTHKDSTSALLPHCAAIVAVAVFVV